MSAPLSSDLREWVHRQRRHPSVQGHHHKAQARQGSQGRLRSEGQGPCRRQDQGQIHSRGGLYSCWIWPLPPRGRLDRRSYCFHWTLQRLALFHLLLKTGEIGEDGSIQNY